MTKPALPPDDLIPEHLREQARELRQRAAQRHREIYGKAPPSAEAYQQRYGDLPPKSWMFLGFLYPEEPD